MFPGKPGLSGGGGARAAVRGRAPALGRGGRRPGGAGRARAVPGPAPRQRALRGHDQRLPGRGVPRDAGEGGRLPPGLAGRGAPRLQRVPGWAPGRAPPRRRGRRGRGQHRPRRVQGAPPAGRRPWRRSRSAWSPTRPSSTGSASGPARPSRSRWSPSRGATLETVAESVRFFEDHLFAAGGARRAGLPDRARAEQRRGRAPPPPRRVLRRLPHRGGVRGRPRRPGRAPPGRDPRREGPAMPARPSSARAAPGAGACAVFERHARPCRIARRGPLGTEGGARRSGPPARDAGRETPSRPPRPPRPPRAVRSADAGGWTVPPSRPGGFSSASHRALMPGA